MFQLVEEIIHKELQAEQGGTLVLLSTKIPHCVHSGSCSQVVVLFSFPSPNFDCIPVPKCTNPINLVAVLVRSWSHSHSPLFFWPLNSSPSEWNSIFPGIKRQFPAPFYPVRTLFTSCQKHWKLFWVFSVEKEEEVVITDDENDEEEVGWLPVW